MSSLTPNQVKLQLERLQGWTLDGNSLVKTYQFASFADAIAFMTRVAFYCQELEHYPTWENCYRTLKVRIGDADQYEVHGRDIQLAKRMEMANGVIFDND
ncbi:4a-hydroxytetrahydrobiopterin dehydratase [Moraxella marmotae]|uniref:4a-hydroxytetrahydrobiopterin dehydratase n=1 Tax=Moraxella marmotae TaxID=3344520 RepID=UPI0035D4B4B1